MVVVQRRRLNLAAVLTAVAPAIPLAQAIGRWGNWWSQELFGRPTTLPWGLEISSDKVPPGIADGTLFHPTFLYESLWSLGLRLDAMCRRTRRSALASVVTLTGCSSIDPFAASSDSSPTAGPSPKTSTMPIWRS